MNKEQITFDGIPIPLTMETILNAYHESYTLWAAYEFGDPMEHWSNQDRRKRQFAAFRSRILRMDAENAEQLAQAEIQERNLNKVIAELKERREIIDADKHHLWNINKEQREQLADKDTRIAQFAAVERAQDARIAELEIYKHDYEGLRWAVTGVGNPPEELT